MSLDLILYTSNAWLIIGLVLCILELSDGRLVFFLPMGVSGLLVGLILKLQESESIMILLTDWAWTTTFWAFLALVLSLILNKVVKVSDDKADINKY